MKRRNFLQQMMAGSTVFALPQLKKIKPKPLEILVLGGTVFLGPAIVNEAVARGHRVTLLNRGITNPILFDSLPLIKGDRKDGERAYAQAGKTRWDVVIDVWPEKSKLVSEAAKALKGSSNFYLFISSISVYADFSEIGITEESKTLQPGPDPASWYYGEEKVMAERSVRAQFPANSAILRPGPIKGWRDPAGDLLYWLLRLREYNQILGPGMGHDPVQFVDVKDVASLAVSLAERAQPGIFNVTGPTFDTLTWRDFLTRASRHLNSSTEIIYTNLEFLKTHQVQAFDDLPLWVPLSEDPGFMQIKSNKMQTLGASFRSLESTIGDCLAWYETGSTEQSGISRSREKEIILAWDK